MGTITAYVTTEGKRYRVNYRKPDHAQTTKRGFRTKRDAELYLASVEVKKATGEFIDPAASRTTIEALGRDWIVQQTHLKPSSLRPVQIAWRLQVEPYWGKHQVGSIRHSDVQAWVSRLTTGDGKTIQPRSATTVLRAYGVLAAILDNATKDRRIPSNPARGIDLPRKIKKPHIYLSHEQVQALADESGKHSTLVLLLAYTGLRWGEATGIRIRNIDTRRRRLNVVENAVSVSGTIHVGTPKSHQSRSVPYPEFLSLPIKELCEQQGDARNRDELLFGDGINHQRQPDARRGWFVYAKRRSGVPTSLTIHDLRHTAASLAISAGANVKAVQRMLGHASAAMTLDTYADLFDDDLDAVAIALNQAKSDSNVVKLWSKDASES
ncbi:site-specific integrase [Leifsonia sp. Root112D2]|uniref:site-specific integrase n=1 Tax=Leifsonia sp. Root112D2 TaxID=1736426 RepID=UPI0006F1CD88|nr:tyrosine-type recombinase/integrase [Leifsonia sp. Root112D2]KQV07058.1 integrase [Leifsonia sp. Root112D2]